MSHKRIFITGASQGIGKALAFEYAAKGAELFLTARSYKDLEIISGEINKQGGTAYYAKCDVTCAEDIINAVAKANIVMGGIDLAILNAGISASNWFSEFDPKLCRLVFEVNLFGVLNCIEHLVPLMKRQGSGTIAGVSSLADSRGMPGSGPYNASKSALSQMLASARVELKNHNIKVITVRPGFVVTNLTAKNNFEMPYLMSAEKAAKIIVAGIEKQKRVISFPLPMAILTFLMKIAPVSLFDYAMTKVRYSFRKK